MRFYNLFLLYYYYNYYYYYYIVLLIFLIYLENLYEYNLKISKKIYQF